MTRETVARWARRSVLAGAGFLVAWHLAAVAGAPRRASVVLALHGFVLHVVVGKAYSLVPSYFDRQLTVGWAPALQVPLTALGAAGMALAGWPDLAVAGVEPAAVTWGGEPAVGVAGTVCWVAGIALFAGAVLHAVRDNLAGSETATSEANEQRRPVDRVANVFMPVAVAYLVAGTYATLAPPLDLPLLIDGYPPRASHLLAAGGAALLLFAIGLRLLPRFMVVATPRIAPWAILPAGAAGPALIAVGLPAGSTLHAGAGLEALAVVAFAATVWTAFARTDRDRVGLWGPVLGAAAGVVAAGLGLYLAIAGIDPPLVIAHLRLNLVGFLGLSIVGTAYQFYPPGVGSFPGAGDRAAAASMALLAAGLAVQTGGLVVDSPAVALGGELLGTAGAALFAYLVGGLLAERGEL